MHVIGYDVYVILDSSRDPAGILMDDAWRYYAVEDYSWEKTLLEDAIRRVRPVYSLAV